MDSVRSRMEKITASICQQINSVGLPQTTGFADVPRNSYSTEGRLQYAIHNGLLLINAYDINVKFLTANASEVTIGTITLPEGYSFAIPTGGLRQSWSSAMTGKSGSAWCYGGDGTIRVFSFDKTADISYINFSLVVPLNTPNNMVSNNNSITEEKIKIVRITGVANFTATATAETSTAYTPPQYDGYTHSGVLCTGLGCAGCIFEGWSDNKLYVYNTTSSNKLVGFVGYNLYLKN